MDSRAKDTTALASCYNQNRARRSAGTGEMTQLLKSHRGRRSAVFGVWLVLLLAGCDGSGAARHHRVPARDAGVATATVPADGAPRGPKTSWATRYYEGYLAETLHGDVAAARAAYSDVITNGADKDPVSAARAALRLAELERLAGNRRKAQELVARAAVLGQSNLAIVERADRAQSHLASLHDRGSEVRGPPAGTALEGVSQAARDAFRAAEGLLTEYHRRQLQPRLEGVRAGIRAKERAMEAAERAYHEVIAFGEREATVAAELRIGSLHHDLALALLFDVPPELEAEEAAKLRRSLRGRALTNLRKARAAYERSLEAAGDDKTPALTERWRLAAELGLRAVKDLLAGHE